MVEKNKETQPFLLKDCALAAIATGVRAQNIKELRDKLLTIQPECIYYHFWGSLLRPRFDQPEYINDFAGWVKHSIHDNTLAERLGVIDPTDFEDLEDLRQELIDELEERLDECEVISWADNDKQFHFIRSKIVVFDTKQVIYDPKELVDIIPRITASSVFYHFIDARRRFPVGVDDFRAWLSGYGNKYLELCNMISHIDPYFLTLTELRDRLAEVFKKFFSG